MKRDEELGALLDVLSNCAFLCRQRGILIGFRQYADLIPDDSFHLGFAAITSGMTDAQSDIIFAWIRDHSVGETVRRRAIAILCALRCMREGGEFSSAIYEERQCETEALVYPSLLPPSEEALMSALSECCAECWRTGPVCGFLPFLSVITDPLFLLGACRVTTGRPEEEMLDTFTRWGHLEADAPTRAREEAIVSTLLRIQQGP